MCDVMILRQRVSNVTILTEFRVVHLKFVRNSIEEIVKTHFCFHFRPLSSHNFQNKPRRKILTNSNKTDISKMMLHPFFSDFDDGYHHYNPRSYQQHRRHTNAVEEARRRRRIELERYYRMKELEEQERLRQNHEYMKCLRRQQLEEEAYQAALFRQRALQEETDELQEHRHALRYLWGDDHSDEEVEEVEDCSEESEVEEEPIYRLMRGVDGRIYRVQVGATRKGKKFAHRTRELPGMKLYSEPTRPEVEPAIATDFMSPKVVEQPDALHNIHRDELKTGDTKVKMNSKEKGTKKKKRVTIIVEDASDSEVDDDLKSPWRNRRPSPGEWMEPVKNFDNMHS